MFTLPGPGEQGVQIEGTDDAHPILLEGIQKLHFKFFLKVLYPKLYKCLPAAGVLYDETNGRNDSVNTYSDWIGVLHLSNKWDFPKIRKLAIESVSPYMPPSFPMRDKVALAKKYNVKKWLLEEYGKLVLQKDSLDVGGLTLQLGMSSSDIISLLQIRELYFARSCRGCSHSCYASYSPRLDVDKLILERFAAHFVSMEDE